MYKSKPKYEEMQKYALYNLVYELEAFLVLHLK